MIFDINVFRQGGMLISSKTYPSQRSKWKVMTQVSESKKVMEGCYTDQNFKKRSPWKKGM
jgi:hypothetical protein